MSHEAFLRIPHEHRIALMTKNKITASDIAQGKIKNMTLSFIENGKLQNDLYVNTTFGQVLPGEVRVVRVNGVQYIRE